MILVLGFEVEGSNCVYTVGTVEQCGRRAICNLAYV